MCVGGWFSGISKNSSGFSIEVKVIVLVVATEAIGADKVSVCDDVPERWW